jgi:hypothetical protein
MRDGSPTLEKGRAVDTGYSTGDYPTRPCCATTALGPALESTCVLGMDYQRERGREFKKELTGRSVGGFCQRHSMQLSRCP